jgi:hypothetical protein
MADRVPSELTTVPQLTDAVISGAIATGSVIRMSLYHPGVSTKEGIEGLTNFLTKHGIGERAREVGKLRRARTSCARAGRAPSDAFHRESDR